MIYRKLFQPVTIPAPGPTRSCAAGCSARRWARGNGTKTEAVKLLQSAEVLSEYCCCLIGIPLNPQWNLWSTNFLSYLVIKFQSYMSLSAGRIQIFDSKLFGDHMANSLPATGVASLTKTSLNVMMQTDQILW